MMRVKRNPFDVDWPVCVELFQGLRHHHAPTGPGDRREAGDHVLLDGRRIEPSDARFSGHHPLHRHDLGDILYLLAPGLVGVGNDIAQAVNDGRMAPTAKGDGLLIIYNDVRAQLTDGNNVA